AHCRSTGSTLPSLRLFGSGGAPVPPELVDAAPAPGTTAPRPYGATAVRGAAWNRPASPAAARRDPDAAPPARVGPAVRHGRGGAQVAVVGLPDDRLGEITCACLVLEVAAEIDLPRLVEALRGEGLATYKSPERLAIFDELPTTPSGKIQKHRIVSAITDGTV